jgi:hypothetical protein
MGQNTPGERFAAAPTIDRGRRCENCRHFNNGTMAVQHYKAKRHAEITAKAKEIFERGGPLTGPLVGRLGDADPHSMPRRRAVSSDFGDIDSRMQALGLNYEFGDQLMREGKLGLCMIGATDADFVQSTYFCGNKYDPKVVVDGAAKHDETPEEARERLGMKD